MSEYNYASLQFNEKAPRESNIHDVTYESYSTSLIEGVSAEKKERKDYYILETEKATGEKVAFVIKKSILDKLEQGKTYSFQLSNNTAQSFSRWEEDKRVFGICKTPPKLNK